MKYPKNFENKRAGFLLRCQNSLWQTTPEMMHFQALMGHNFSGLFVPFKKNGIKINYILCYSFSSNSDLNTLSIAK